jgi:hypothetical protein
MALRCFKQIEEKLERDQVGRMELILHLPFQYGLSRCLLGLGDLDQARKAAHALFEQAALPGERTYVGLAHHTLADIALAGDDLNRAVQEIEHALNVVKCSSLPHAEWRVHHTAAKVYEKKGLADSAVQHWTHRSSVLRRLAESLDDSDELRESLLNGAGKERSPLSELARYKSH